MHTLNSNYLYSNLKIDREDHVTDPVLQLIKSIILDLENKIRLGIICHQEASEKYKELSTKKRLLEEALIRCEGRAEHIEPEVQLRDLWLRNCPE